MHGFPSNCLLYGLLKTRALLAMTVCGPHLMCVSSCAERVRKLDIQLRPVGRRPEASGHRCSLRMHVQMASSECRCSLTRWTWRWMARRLGAWRHRWCAGAQVHASAGGFCPTTVSSRLQGDDECPSAMEREAKRRRDRARKHGADRAESHRAKESFANDHHLILSLPLQPEDVARLL